MNVTIGNYRITASGKYGFDLYETIEVEAMEKVSQPDGKFKMVKTGEKKDKEEWVGFYGNLQALADKLFWLDLKRSDAATLEEMLTVMGSTRQMIKTAGLTNE